MKPIQVIIRDLYGLVVFKNLFPNLPMAALGVALFVKMWEKKVGQVILVSIRKTGFERSVFKVHRDQEGLYLKARDGETVRLPEPPEDEDGFDEEDDPGDLI